MRWRYPLILAAIAVAIFLAGVGYGVVQVGVPTPDASPEVAAAEARDVRISGYFMGAGTVLFVVSFLWLGMILGDHLTRRIYRRLKW